MREEYRLRVKEKGFGRAFHALNEGREPKYVRELVAWINSDAELNGWQKIQGHSEAWLKEDEIKMGKLRERFEKRKQEQEREQEEKKLEIPGIYNLKSQGSLPNSSHLLFNGSGSHGKLEGQAVA
ncbi:hypothetical protein EYC80_001402 [Monilinia laxa]|nr:hypothetical protein EYC80_001402 [Monilinia laxa]